MLILHLHSCMPNYLDEQILQSISFLDIEPVATLLRPEAVHALVS